MKCRETSKYFAIYSRKSKFTGKGESIENQIELCRQRLLSMEVPEEDMLVFEDEGFSGGNTNRPRFRAMMNEVRSGRLRGVICYRLDRISRNVADFAEIQKDFDEYGVDFISLRDNFDTTTPTGRAMMMMTSVFAQLERETIAERIRDNMYELAKSGRWLGGRTPTGYRSGQTAGSVTVDGKVHKAYRLENVPEELETVRLIFARFLETGSLTKVDAYLLERGVMTKHGNQFTRFSISAILRNPVYLTADEAAWAYFERNQVEVFAGPAEFDGKHGVMAYNKTIQKTGKTNQMRAMDEWIVSLGKHEGLISGEDWVRAQELLERNKSKAYRRPKSNTALLSGLLVCGACDKFMRPKLTQRRNATGESVYTYLCEQKERSHGAACNMKNVSGNELDKRFWERLSCLKEDAAEFRKRLEGIKKTLEQGSPERSRLEAARREQKETGQKIANLVAGLAAAQDTAAAGYITVQINELHERNETLSRQIEELQMQGAEYHPDDFGILQRNLLHFGSCLSLLGLEQKRSALRVLIRKIEWDGESAHVYLLGDRESAVPYGEDSK